MVSSCSERGSGSVSRFASASLIRVLSPVSISSNSGGARVSGSTEADFDFLLLSLLLFKNENTYI